MMLAQGMLFIQAIVGIKFDQHVIHLFLFLVYRGDQSQQICVLMQTIYTAMGPNSGLMTDGVTVALVVELLSYNSTSPESAPTPV